MPSGVYVVEYFSEHIRCQLVPTVKFHGENHTWDELSINVKKTAAVEMSTGVNLSEQTLNRPNLAHSLPHIQSAPPSKQSHSLAGVYIGTNIPVSC